MAKCYKGKKISRKKVCRRKKSMTTKNGRKTKSTTRKVTLCQGGVCRKVTAKVTSRRAFNCRTATKAKLISHLRRIGGYKNLKTWKKDELKSECIRQS